MILIAAITVKWFIGLLILNIVLMGIMFFLFAEVMTIRHNMEDRFNEQKSINEDQQKHTKDYITSLTELILTIKKFKNSKS